MRTRTDMTKVELLKKLKIEFAELKRQENIPEDVTAYDYCDGINIVLSIIDKYLYEEKELESKEQKSLEHTRDLLMNCDYWGLNGMLSHREEVHEYDDGK